MPRFDNPWCLAATVVLLAMGASGLSAEEKRAPEAAAIERSRVIRAELARIEANKEAFVDELIASWAAVLDPATYDVQREIKPLAMAAIPWQLYGASLVGDFNTMVKLLSNKVGAGRYVKALSEPQPRKPVDPKVLGSYTDSLVFNPIPPCRMVDTRGTGARTGIINPGSPRTFDLTTDGYSKGQGGVTGGCTGLPAYSHLGWAANITATGFTAMGGLQAFPFGGPASETSIINYDSGPYAIANAATLTGCNGCTDDVIISAFGSPSHVVVDVLGYYSLASGFASSAVFYLAGEPVTTPPGVQPYACGGYCPPGTEAIGGYYTTSGGCPTIPLSYSWGSYWCVTLVNPPPMGTCTLVAYSECQDVQ